VRQVALGPVDQPPLQHDVLQPVGQPRGRRLAVPAGPAGLLVVALDRLGQVQVRHEADVGLVDAHPERDRGHHDQAVLAQEPGLVRGPGGPVKPGVVRQRGQPVAAHPRFSPRPAAVHDARVAVVLAADQPERRAGSALARPVLDVRPVELDTN
jgi:hypothetical protein